MKKAVFTVLGILFLSNSYAASIEEASNVVKSYSKTVACAITENLEYQKNQYKAIEIDPGFEDMDGLSSKHLVFWEGDFGCNGGNGTVVPNFTLVEHAGHSSVPPIVRVYVNFPILDLVTVKIFEGKGGDIFIDGVTYGANDHQHYPTKKVSYHIKYENEKFVLQ